MLMPSSIPTVAEVFAERLTVCLIGGTIIAFVAWGLLRVGSYGSRARYTIWWSALVASVFLLFPHVAISGHAPVSSGQSAPLTLPGSWALYIFLFWTIGALVAALRIVLGAVRIRQLRKSCGVLDLESLSPEVRETLEQIPSLRSAKLCTSSAISVPSVLGFFKPVVVIPAHLLNEIAPADLKQVLLHELAHLKYWDDWANLVQKLLRATLFFHPAAWWMDRQLTLEREMACDDFVVRQTGDSMAYARCLAALAEVTFARRTVALVQAAVSRAGQTSARVGRLLKLKTPRTDSIFRPTLSIAGLVLVAGFAVRAYSPDLIEFRNDNPQTEIASAAAATMPVPAVAENASKNLTAPVTNVRASKQRSVPSSVRAENTARHKSTSTAVPVKFIAHAQKQHVLTAKYHVPTSQAVAVEQGYFTVVSNQPDGITTVSYWQFTVWRVNQAQQPKSTDRKIT